MAACGYRETVGDSDGDHRVRRASWNSDGEKEKTLFLLYQSWTQSSRVETGPMKDCSYGSTGRLMPLHLQGASVEPAPDQFIDVAAKYEGEDVWFVDDLKKCNNSIRYGKVIYVNTRCTYWDTMIPSPIWCRDACEAIVLRFLHELGHVHQGHIGDPGLVSTSHGLEIGRTRDFLSENFRGTEGKAWEFALDIRKNHRDEFLHLLSSCRDWYGKHDFKDKDWDDDREDQWQRYNAGSVQEDFPIPVWVEDRFGKYKPNGI